MNIREMLENAANFAGDGLLERCAVSAAVSLKRLADSQIACEAILRERHGAAVQHTSEESQLLSDLAELHEDALENMRHVGDVPGFPGIAEQLRAALLNANADEPEVRIQRYGPNNIADMPAEIRADLRRQMASMVEAIDELEQDILAGKIKNTPVEPTELPQEPGEPEQPQETGDTVEQPQAEPQAPEEPNPEPDARGYSAATQAQVQERIDYAARQHAAHEAQD